MITSGHKVYVMIDGYDAFLEPFLGKELEAEFKNALSYIISFYASLKSLTCDMIAKIFITGCISIGLDYFNITKTCEKPTPLGVGWIAQR